MTGYRSGGGQCWVNAMEMENLSCSACMGKQNVTEESDQERRGEWENNVLRPSRQLSWLREVSNSYTRTALQPHPWFHSGMEGHLEAITGIIYNRTEVMTKKCCSLDRQRRRTGEREGEREDWHEEGEWRSREEETWGWPLPSMWLRQNRLGESKRSDLISRQGAFLRVCRGNSACHKNGTNVGSE